MKRIVPLLLALLMVLAIPASQAHAFSSISDELKAILNDPNTPKGNGLPQLLKDVQGETKAKKTIENLGPKYVTKTDGKDHPTPWPWPYPWYNGSTVVTPAAYYYDWNYNPGYHNWGEVAGGSVYASLHAALSGVKSQTDIGRYPTFYYQSGGALRRGVWNTMSKVYDLEEYNAVGSWTNCGSTSPY